MKFGDRLKFARKCLECTQEELASMCGLSGTAISHFETCSRDPSLKSIIKICRGLKCKPNDLIDIYEL